MARIEWTEEAREDLGRIARFLWEKDQEVANRATSEILKGIRLLKTSPRLGRPVGDETERRALSIPFGSGAYIVHYILRDPETVVVLRLWHSREVRR